MIVDKAFADARSTSSYVNLRAINRNTREHLNNKEEQLFEQLLQNISISKRRNRRAEYQMRIPRTEALATDIPWKGQFYEFEYTWMATFSINERPILDVEQKLYVRQREIGGQYRTILQWSLPRHGEDNEIHGMDLYVYEHANVAQNLLKEMRRIRALKRLLCTFVTSPAIRAAVISNINDYKQRMVAAHGEFTPAQVRALEKLLISVNTAQQLQNNMHAPISTHAHFLFAL